MLGDQRELVSFLPPISSRPDLAHSEPDVVRCSASSSAKPRPQPTKSQSFNVGEDSSVTDASKRRLSQGDDPYWLPQFKEADEINFLLGRVVKTDGSHKIRITEVAPTHSSIRGEEPAGWKMPVEIFSSKKENHKQHKSKRLRSYYKAQAELITAYEDISLNVEVDISQNDPQVHYKKAVLFSKLTFFINFLLMVAKAVASALSGSIAIISSLVDSSLDLFSGVIMWWATRAMKQRDPYTYPQGRTKLEPVAVIILSVVMALASLQLIREAVEKLISLTGMDSSLPIVDAVTFAIAGSTVVVKLVLWIVCRKVKSSVVRALAQDHRNDVVSNTAAIICGYLGSRNFNAETGLYGFAYVDPIGAIAISIYIVINWWQTGSEQIKMLTGHTARPDFLSKLTWVCVNHHAKIRHIDTVRAFHFGNNFLVEVDIVLPADMRLEEAHDIGESLQHRLESLDEVERSFVHLDYEFSHDPRSEHKIV
ncbi:metal tolerance protein 9 [Aplysia californica]|uniref:Metal tolerance protein 9 n=1 Tax=Aplysia californica TaxID=6500 RepID=A0ABM0JYT5_APLCA|nr:metal tolerance protein 9 [Aplysia californica]